MYKQEIIDGFDCHFFKKDELYQKVICVPIVHSNKYTKIWATKGTLNKDDPKFCFVKHVRFAIDLKTDISIFVYMCAKDVNMEQLRKHVSFFFKEDGVSDLNVRYDLSINMTDENAKGIDAILAVRSIKNFLNCPLSEAKDIWDKSKTNPQVIKSYYDEKIADQEIKRLKSAYNKIPVNLICVIENNENNQNQ